MECGENHGPLYHAYGLLRCGVTIPKYPTGGDVLHPQRSFKKQWVDPKINRQPYNCDKICER